LAQAIRAQASAAQSLKAIVTQERLLGRASPKVHTQIAES